MKIGICSPFFPARTALSRYTYDFISYLGREGFDAYLVPIQRDITTYEEIRTIDYKNADFVYIQWGNNLLHHPQSHIFKKIERKISTLHDLDIGGAFKRSCIKCILKGYINPISGKSASEKLLKKIIKDSERIFLNSVYACKYLKNEYRISTEKLFAIKYPVLYGEFQEDKYEVRASLGLPEDKVIFLFVGFISPHKGVEDTVYTLKILKEIYNFEDFVYIVVGEQLFGDAYEQKIRSIIKSSSLKDNIIMTGFISDAPPNYELKKYFIASDFVFLPRRRTFGETSAVIPQAFAAGNVVISSNLGSFPEYLSGRGILVNSGDSIEMQNKIIELLDSPQKFKKIQREAKMYAKDKLDWGVVIKDIINSTPFLQNL
ncbi:MAG: glycosyltransferase family 4 protein [Methanophagales archaeon]|nr:glycosyltransferase family 4 protein [Methanophagales archaeon]